MSLSFSKLDRQAFDRLYHTELLPQLVALEEERLSYLKSLLAWVATGVLIVGLTVKITWGTAITDFRIYVFEGALIAIVAGLFLNSKYQRYRRDFKAKVVARMIGTLFPGFSYLPESGVPRSSYDSSQLFHTTPDRYRSEDFVSGAMGVTKLEFGEVHSEYKTESTDSKGNRSTTWHTIFKGVFFRADFNKFIHGRTFVLPDVAEKSFGKLLGGLMQKANASLESRGQRVELENPVFEKEFVVYSDSQVESRYVLTPAIMERILSLKEAFNCLPHLGFLGSSVYVALPLAVDLFEPRVFTSVVDKESILGYYRAVCSIADIVEELDLNVRIWSKA